MSSSRSQRCCTCQTCCNLYLYSIFAITEACRLSSTTQLSIQIKRTHDDDDESKSYVCLLETVTSVLVIRSDKQFSFQITTERGCKMRSGAGRKFQVDGPATAKLRGPYRSVLVAGTARSPRAAERVTTIQRYQRPAGIYFTQLYTTCFLLSHCTINLDLDQLDSDSAVPCRLSRYIFEEIIEFNRRNAFFSVVTYRHLV